MEIKDITKEAVIIADTATFTEALAVMDSNKTNTLLVTGETGELVGEVTVSDILEAIVPETLDGDQVMSHLSTDSGIRDAILLAAEKPVSEFMSVDFTALEMHDTMISVIATAIAHGRASIPVVDADNRPIGIVSRRGLKQIIRKLGDM